MFLFIRSFLHDSFKMVSDGYAKAKKDSENQIRYCDEAGDLYRNKTDFPYGHGACNGNESKANEGRGLSTKCQKLWPSKIKPSSPCGEPRQNM